VPSLARRTARLPGYRASSRGCSGCRQTDATCGYAPRTRSESFPRGRITTTPGDGEVLGLADAETVPDPDGGGEDPVAAVVTVDVQAAAATSKAKMTRDLGGEPTARR